MPLEPGADRSTVSHNISEMVHSGYPQRVAVAASLHNADKYKGRAGGGGAFNLGDTMGGMMGKLSSSPIGGEIGRLQSGFESSPLYGELEKLIGGFGGKGGQGFNIPFEQHATTPIAQPTAPIGHVAPLPAMPSGATPAGPTNQTTFRAAGGALPWYVRNEARSMLHTGPIKSPVAGRTDHIPLKVPSGSYVLPADHVSHMGQNNTEAGLLRAAHMFGGAGPFGSTLPKVTRGRGAPAAPVPRPQPNPAAKLKSPLFAPGGGAFEGGVKDGDEGEGVDIMAAGGEFVIPPDIVTEIGGGNLDHGHQILDEWVVRTRKEHKKKLAALPPPAK